MARLAAGRVTANPAWRVTLLNGRTLPVRATRYQLIINLPKSSANG
jgi:hypothetical protein